MEFIFICRNLLRGLFCDKYSLDINSALQSLRSIFIITLRSLAMKRLHMGWMMLGIAQVLTQKARVHCDYANQ